MQCPVQVPHSFLVHRNPIGARIGESRNIFVRILDHQVAIERQRRDLAQRLHHRRPDREIGHEMSIHDVDVDDSALRPHKRRAPARPDGQNQPKEWMVPARSTKASEILEFADCRDSNTLKSMCGAREPRSGSRFGCPAQAKPSGASPPSHFGNGCRLAETRLARADPPRRHAAEAARSRTIQRVKQNGSEMGDEREE